MDVKDVLFMNKGDGENSYAHNSAFTQKVASMTKPALEETVRSLFSEESDFHGKRVVNVADLGCAAGPNTFFVMFTVLEAVEKICKELNFRIPEIQFYLNDLPGNDFNTLFNGLSGFRERNENFNKVPYFVLGAPGSFHHRLFPENSMDLIHSSYSVHWLSQVPKLVSEGGVPLNKRKMYISKTSPVIVREAYLAQFQHDFGSFLKCRSQEMVPNGRIILIINGRRTPDPATRESCYTWEVLADAISQMISQGLVDENKLDSFNVPYYTPSVEEVQESVEMERSFTTERLEMLTIDVEDVYRSGAMKMAEAAAKNIRAFTEPIISQQFGEEIMDELYGEFVTKILLNDISKESIKIVSIVIVLKRNV